MSPAVDARELLTIREAARRLRVSEKTTRRLIARADLPAVQLGGPGSPLRVPAVDFEAWLNRSRVTPLSAAHRASPAVEAQAHGGGDKEAA